MKANYLIILAIMAVACYFLFIRRPKAKPSDGNSVDPSNENKNNSGDDT